MIVFFNSCKKDTIAEDSKYKLSFSTDTLLFDTVFTTLGSSTRIFKIYNPNSYKIKVKSINLGGGSGSYFRLNINGKSSSSASNVEIRAKDSLWVFAEVTINPNSTSLPFVVADSLLFETNGNLQKVQLRAWGQNAVFHRPAAGESSFKISCNSVWDNTLPHVVYGTAEIDSNCTLEIKAGAKVYFYNNGALSALKGSSLKISGTESEPVEMEGSRLESWYKNVSGQWLGVYLNNESTGHQINFLELKNSQIGIFGEGFGEATGTPFLTISNSIVQNCSSAGLYFKNCSVNAWNLLSVNCGSSALLVERGGEYNFNHCTFANYLSIGTENSASSVSISNWEYKDQGLVSNDLIACNFNNSILYGTLSNELNLNNNGAAFNYQFNFCLLKSTLDISVSNYNNCIKNEDPDFVNVSDFNFFLNKNSKAINKGNLSLVNLNLFDLEFDLNGNSRIEDGVPDLGAYEFFE